MSFEHIADVFICRFPRSHEMSAWYAPGGHAHDAEQTNEGVNQHPNHRGIDCVDTVVTIPTVLCNQNTVRDIIIIPDTGINHNVGTCSMF